MRQFEMKNQPKFLNDLKRLLSEQQLKALMTFVYLGQQDLYEYCNRPRRHILEVS